MKPPDGCDVIVIGAGLAGLTAAGLLAARGLQVLVIERNYQPGGACGAIRRQGVSYDLGAAMLFGFGEKGFNPHRFVMNELEEPIEVVRHRVLYRLNYLDKPIVFWPERERYHRELDRAFPEAGGEIRGFYAYIADLYEKVIQTDPVFVSPTEMTVREMARQFLRRPLRQARSLALLFRSAGSLMRRYVRSEQVIRFFNKLTSTYCYTAMDETPAILAATMFIDNHTGGSYYPAGSPAQLSGRLERAIERRGGRFLYETEAAAILMEGRRVRGVRTADGREFAAPQVVYAGAIHPLVRRLLPAQQVPPAYRRRIEALKMTYPSVVLYGLVRAEAVPEGTLPVEMFADNEQSIDESEVTIYISSLEDPNLCPPGRHCFTLIGPSLRAWPPPSDPAYGGAEYQAQKKEEIGRLLGLLNRCFPGFARAVEYCELATPSTIERYLGKPGGSVAGPKQAMGQHLMLRPHARTRWKGLYLAGECTVMGTGTPAVTVSGVSAASLALRDRKMPEYRAHPQERSYVTVREGPLPRRQPPASPPGTASLCQWCEKPACREKCPARIDVRGSLRRMEMENFLGARRCLEESGGSPLPCLTCKGRPCEQVCARTAFAGAPVPIADNLIWLAAQPRDG